MIYFDGAEYAQRIKTMPSNNLAPLAFHHQHRGIQQQLWVTITQGLGPLLLPWTAIASWRFDVHLHKTTLIWAEMESRGIEAVRGERWMDLSPTVQAQWINETDTDGIENELECLEDFVRRGFPMYVSQDLGSLRFLVLGSRPVFSGASNVEAIPKLIAPLLRERRVVHNAELNKQAYANVVAERPLREARRAAYSDAPPPYQSDMKKMKT
jgi:hypothetical protein